ncbi:MAG: TRAP transporter substrate-binding protein DctP [Burkholderiales bacterium]|nr:TRAP transporter substrate-binding protein DctP [Burkholderiales bacterium]
MTLSRAVAGLVLAATLALPAWAQQRIDLAVFHPENNFWTATIKWWIEEVDKATQGRVKFNPHFAGSLVGMNETFKSVREGAVPSGVIAMGVVSGQIPSMAYLEAIGGLPDKPDDFIAATAALRPVLEEQFRKFGVEYLWSQGSTALIVLCRDRHLRSLADWKGRKVRTAGRWQGQQIGALGASPVALDPAEQYLGLQNGTIDCALSNSVLASAAKLYEVGPKITVLRLPVNLSAYIVNSAVYGRISGADRAAIRRLGAEAEKRSAPYLDKMQGEAQALMKTHKADIYVLSDAEMAAFRKGIFRAFAKMDAESGAAGKQVQAVLKRYW